MTARERLLAAYRRQKTDRLPVSPEIWSATVLEYKREEFHRYLGPFADKDFIAAWLETQQYFGSDPWLVVDLNEPDEGEAFTIKRKSYYISPDVIETSVETKTTRGDLLSVKRTNKDYEYWSFSHPVKDFEKDMPAYLMTALSDPFSYGDRSIAAALKTVGEDGLVSANLGELFISFLAYSREGDIGQTLIDLYDHEEYIRELQGEYIGYLCAKVDRMSRIKGLESIFINCGYSDGGVLGPDHYRKWEVPLLTALAKKSDEYGFAFHLHQHGKCRKILHMIADAGVDLVDSLERPTANGDIDDLAEVKREIGDRLALKGNIDPMNVLKLGSREDVRKQARECIEAAADGRGYILGTGDSVIEGTPFENIFELVETGLNS